MEERSDVYAKDAPDRIAENYTQSQLVKRLNKGLMREKFSGRLELIYEDGRIIEYYRHEKNA